MQVEFHIFHNDCHQKKKQLYFNAVLIYTDNKVKLKEGKRRNDFAIIFFLPAIVNSISMPTPVIILFSPSSSYFYKSNRFSIGKYKKITSYRQRIERFYLRFNEVNDCETYQ